MLALSLLVKSIVRIVYKMRKDFLILTRPNIPPVFLVLICRGFLSKCSLLK